VRSISCVGSIASASSKPIALGRLMKKWSDLGLWPSDLQERDMAKILQGWRNYNSQISFEGGYTLKKMESCSSTSDSKYAEPGEMTLRT
jgi:hypothetical protein